MQADLLTTKEVERLIQLNRVTIYRLIREEGFPAVKIGNQWRFPREQVQAWLSAHELSTQDAQEIEGKAAPALPRSTEPHHLFNNIEVTALLEAFATALNLSVSVITPGGKPLIDFPKCRHPFCEYLQSQGRVNCLALDRRVIPAQSSEAKLHLLQCEAGLRYLQAPVRFQGETIAYVLMGPIVMATDQDSELHFSLGAFANATGSDPQVLLQHYQSVQKFSLAQTHILVELLSEVMSTMLTVVSRRIQAVEQLGKIAELVADGPP